MARTRGVAEAATRSLPRSIPRRLIHCSAMYVKGGGRAESETREPQGLKPRGAGGEMSKLKLRPPSGATERYSSHQWVGLRGARPGAKMLFPAAAQTGEYHG